LAEDIEEEEIRRLRISTHTGRPLGSDSFVSKLESMIGRRLRALPVGRPKKKIKVKLSKKVPQKRNHRHK
jgi:hypothetical protein